MSNHSKKPQKHLSSGSYREESFDFVLFLHGSILQGKDFVKHNMVPDGPIIS